MTHPAYPTILERLSQLEDDPYDITKHDLLGWGITAEMIPDLIETILDEKYYHEYGIAERNPHLYAYIALGQLKTIAAIDGLILGVKKWSHTNWFDWFSEAMPDIFGAIGAIAIPALIPVLQDESLTRDARSSAAQYLYHISVTHPEERDRCVAILIEQLEKFADNDREFNGDLVVHLVADFKAVAAAPVIEAAYAADRVEDFFLGDWEDVQVDLGLIPARISPPSRQLLVQAYSEDEKLQRAFDLQSQQMESIIEAQGGQFRNTNSKNKAKRKQAKKSRKQNRRK